jgi:hypothetical protein
LEASVSGSGSIAALLNEISSVAVSLTGSADLAITLTVSVEDVMLKTDGCEMVSLPLLGESITYYPGGVIGNAKTINAIVERLEPDLHDYGTADSATTSVEFWVCTDDTKGVSTPSPGQDLADVIIREGDSASRVRIVELIEDDPGLWKLLGVK